MKKLLFALVLLAMFIPAFGQTDGMSLLEKGEYSIVQGDYEQAFEYAAAHLNNHPKDPEAYMLLALCCVNSGHNLTALEYTNLGIQHWNKKSKHELSKFYVMRAFVYQSEGNHEKALDEYATAISKGGEQKGKIYLERGKLYYDIDDYENAEKDFATALKEDKEDKYIILLWLAKCQIAQKHYDNGGQTLDEVLAADPRNADALRLRALTYLHQSNPSKKKCIDYYIRHFVATEEADHDEMHDAMSLDYEYGLKSLSAAINTAEDNASKYRMLMIRQNLLSDSLRYDEALRDLDQLQQIAAKQGTFDNYASYLKAFYLIRIYRYQEALTELERLNNANLTAEAQAYVKYTEGECRISMGDLPNAAHNFTEAMALDSSYVSDACYNRGKIRHMQGNMPAALDDYEVAFLCNPSNHSKKYFHARALIEAEQSLMTAVNEMLDLANDSTCRLDTRMFALHFLNRDAEAINLMNEMLAHSPSPVDYYNAACLMALTGDRLEMYKLLRTAAEKGYRSFNYIMVDMDFSQYRDSTEFQRFIEEIENEYR